MSVRDLIMTAAGSSAPTPPLTASTWITTLDDGAWSDGFNCYTDSSGNVYTVAYGRGYGSYICTFVSKLNLVGELQWERVLYGDEPTDLSHTDNFFGYGITVDLSGNVYVSGTRDIWDPVFGGGSYRNVSILVKYNSSGVLQWQRQLYNTGCHVTANVVLTDSVGDVYITGSLEADPDTFPFIIKYNPSGVLQWQTYYSGIYPNRFKFDASNNIYATGSSTLLHTIKFNSSGVIQWQRALDPGGGIISLGFGIAIDPSGNVYVTGYIVNSPTQMIVAKYNSLGVLQWQKLLASGAPLENTQGNAITVDAVGNTYAIGYDAGVSGATIVKYDTNGTLIWQNKLYYPDTAVGLFDISNIGTDWFQTVGYSYNIDWIDYTTVAQFKTDGSDTGTYGPFVYEANNMTESSGTCTDTAGIVTVVTTQSVTDAEATLIDVAASLMQTLYY